MPKNDIVAGFDEVPCDRLEVCLSTVEALGHCIVIALNGYLDAGNADCFLGRLRIFIDADSIILHAVRISAGDIMFMNVQPPVYEVLQLLGVSQVFPIKENLEDAVSHFVSRLDGVQCPICCSRTTTVSRSGRHHCRECHTVLAIDPAGKVSLG